MQRTLPLENNSRSLLSKLSKYAFNEMNDWEISLTC